MSLQATEATALSVANSPILWACAVGVFLIITVQSLIYIKAAKKAAPAAGLTERDLKTAFRVGAVTAVAPSLAVVLVALALLSIFGGPAVLVRIGLVGSAAYETAAGQTAASSVGATLGGEGYNADTFALVFTAITLGGICWMITTLILTPLMRRGSQKAEAVNPLIMTLVPVAAMVAAFTTLGIGSFSKGTMNIIAFFAAALIMGCLLFLYQKLKMQWIREWSLGLTLILTFALLYFLPDQLLTGAN